ncbi:MAG: FoF1 ATP synthase subunit delta/epsilon [Planctomycetota bacterium]
MNNFFLLEVSTYERKCLVAKVSSLIIPAYDGLMGIKKGHAKAICLLRPGVIEVEYEQNKKEKYAIGEGVCHIMPEKVILLVRSFEKKQDIDKGRLQISREKIVKKVSKLEEFAEKEQKKILNSFLRYQARTKLIS